MHITWHGQSCFKIQGKEVTIITDPYHKEIGLKVPRFKGDIVTVSHRHISHDNTEAVKNDPKIVEGPGEYNIKGVNILGVETYHDAKDGADLGPNTVYVIEMEKIKICHLGDLGHKLTDVQTDRVDGVDILLVPVGETNLLSMKEIVETINAIEPKIVIPMHYKIPGLKTELSTIDKFCEEMSLKGSKAEPKLNIKYKNLPKTETETVILQKS